MGANVEMSGKLALPAMAAWLAQRLQSSYVDDLAAFHGQEPPTPKPPKATVGDAIVAFRMVSEPWGWTMRVDKNVLLLSGETSDDGYRECGGALIRLLASAAATGGRGRVQLCAVGDEEFLVDLVAEKKMLRAVPGSPRRMKKIAQENERIVSEEDTLARFRATRALVQLFDKLPKPIAERALLASLERSPARVRKRAAELVKSKKLFTALRDLRGEDDGIADALFIAQIDAIVTARPSSEVLEHVAHLGYAGALGAIKKRVLRNASRALKR